ncbi:MAG: MmcQ/YjbR family DNA-binding protein [Candidatus Acidiferrum sp.]
MNIDWVRDLCLSFPRATEEEVWTNDLTFKVAGKMFAHTVLIPASVWLSFKASPEQFAELTERPGIIPAPYLARAQWVALETKDALPPEELAPLLRASYDMVVAKLPKKARAALISDKSPAIASSPKVHKSKRSSVKLRTKIKKPSR